MSDLREQALKLAHKNPELRKHLLPLIKEGAPLPKEVQEDEKAGLPPHPRYEESRTVKKAGAVANTILKQMGGQRRLMMMIGAKNFVDLGKGVGFRWPNKQRSKGNYVEIKLTGSDLYDMTFFNLSMKAKKKVKEYRGLYFDMLVDTFENQTGWYLRMASQNKTAAGIDFYDQWLGIQQKNNQRLHKEYTQLLKKVSKVMTQAGLKLDMSRSSVGSYNKGSDGRVMEGLLVFKDLAFDEVFLTRDEVRDWFEKHLDLYPQLTERSQGTWAADITAN